MTTRRRRARSRRSSSRRSTWLRLDASSALTGSSQISSRGSHDQRAGDRDALALAAGDPPGRPRQHGRVEADQSSAASTRAPTSAREPAGDGAAPRRRSAPRSWSGSSERSGSWKTNCTGRYAGTPAAPCRAVAEVVLPSNLIRPDATG